MSMLDSDRRSPVKHSGFRLFKRKKVKKVPKPPGLMKLPDSAISARTRRGSRHIAISIPIEFDHPDIPKVPHRSNQRNALTTARKDLKSQHPDAVVVLKPMIHQPTKLSPLAEVHEATSPPILTKAGERKRDSRNSRSNYTVISEGSPSTVEPPKSQKSRFILEE
jgi:hypothetical protein